MDVVNEIILGNCIYNSISKGNLHINIKNLVLPYILQEVLLCNNSLLVYNRQQNLIRTCRKQVPTQDIEALLLLQSGSYIELE